MLQIYTKFFYYLDPWYVINAKINLGQYVIFIRPRKVDTTDILKMFYNIIHENSGKPAHTTGIRWLFFRIHDMFSLYLLLHVSGMRFFTVNYLIEILSVLFSFFFITSHM